ncbi:germin-like protein subfamily 1 member 17 [Olea europaea var. sylvestris]|uniref:germin-like protein subfamily 1 member 17 n=1 Tax=Olea europaea var. sylvestris TaxID=158386 RepID=UPI000C1D40AD|nr:germin-like protein subfamily 1 member 17 [Olea europaea var. sylvestris]
MAVRLLISVLIISLVSLTYASDPDPLQDFCVAVKDDEAKVFVNGKICKDPNMVSADDFLFPGPNMPGLNVPGNTSNPLGSKVTPVNVNQLPGLNTLGISLVRIDYAPYGLNPPHTHPRATEVLVVVEGTLYVGFVTSNPADPNVKNKLFTKTLKPGDVFVFPEGLIHFQFNVGKKNAVVFAGLSSQNPGVITIANAVFGSDPPINPDVLTKAFQVDSNVIQYLQGQFWWNID